MVMQLARSVKRYIVKLIMKSVMKLMVAVYSSVECAKMAIDLTGNC